MGHYVSQCLLPHGSPNTTLNVGIIPQYLAYILFTCM